MLKDILTEEVILLSTFGVAHSVQAASSTITCEGGADQKQMRKYILVNSFVFVCSEPHPHIPYNSMLTQNVFVWLIMHNVN